MNKILMNVDKEEHVKKYGGNGENNRIEEEL